MKIGFLLPIIALIYIYSAHALLINEVMYNPDDANEWVELYNDNQELDFSNFTLTDNYETDNLICCSFDPNCTLIVPQYSFVIITDQDTTLYNNLTTNAVKLCVDDNSIGNGLGNSADSIIIKQNNVTFDNLTYNGSWSMKGYSIERFADKWRQSLQKGGSPGRENPQIQNNYKISFNYNPALGINENLFFVSKEDCMEEEIEFYYNISEPFFENNITEIIGCNKSLGTVEITDYGDYLICASIKNFSICRSFSIQQQTCNASISIKTDKEFYYNNETVKYNFIVQPESAFIIEYWIEDIVGNIVKNKYNSSSTTQKLWKVSTEENDAIFFIKANLYSDCGNAYAEKIFFAVNNQNKSNEPVLEIKEYPENVTFGDIIRIKVSVSRGNSTKSATSYYIYNGKEKVSEETKITLYSKDINEFLIPIKLKDNCNQEYGEGNYELVAEGLDLESKKDIFVSGKSGLCPKNKDDNPEANNSKKSLFYELLPHPKEIEGKEFGIDLRIENQDSKEHRALIQSYVYKGSVTYSGEREENQYELTLEAGAKEIIHFDFILNNKTKPGEYKIKVKIYKDDLKTPYELTENITILESEEEAVDIDQKTVEKTTQKETGTKEIKDDLTLNQENLTFYSDNGKDKQKYFYIVGFGFVLLFVLLVFLVKKDYSLS